jgi:hypothetical protein
MTRNGVITMDYGKANLRQKLTLAVFVAVVGVFFALSVILGAPEILVSERRIPAAFPELSARSLLSGSFMSKFEGYADDSFPLRDGFRALRAATVLGAFMQSDKSGLYADDAVGLSEMKAIDEVSFRQTARKLTSMAGRLEGVNVYFSVIPDKGAYASRYMPGYDHAAAEAILAEELAGYAYIPLKERLSAGSYYRTDLHWDQTKIAATADYLLSTMGANTSAGDLPTITAGEFHGVYAGQFALPTAPEPMSYFDIPGLSARYLSEDTLEFEPGPVHDPARISDVDPYDLFLGGPQPLIVIDNAEAANTRELYLFRDSFGSSIAPLLARGYARVTLIDLRYINAEVLSQFVEFTPGSDALFLYGSQIFNNPSILQVQ